MRPRSRPFYPVQTPTGETYVARDNNFVVSSVFCTFDEVGRWRIAVQRADRMNDEFQARFYRRRRLLAVLVLIGTLAAGLGVFTLLR